MAGMRPKVVVLTMAALKLVLGRIPLAMAALLAAGCGSTAYQMVKTEATPPVEKLALQATAEGVELTLEGLIVYDGPGTWKRSAYWDEYVVRVVNQHADPVEIEALILGDVLDRSVPSGTDPWELEKAGRKHESYLQSLCAPANAALSSRQRPHLPLGFVDTATGIAGGAVATMVYVPVLAPAIAGPVLIYGAPFALLAYTPVFLTNKLFVDPKNRELVLAEFNRRRLQLPATLQTGSAISGSVFFPLTPGPERISVRGRTTQGVIEVRLELPGLEGLHFTYAPDKAALKAAAPKGRFFDFRKPIPERKAPPESSSP